MARLLLSLQRFARLWAALRPISAADCNRRNPAIAAAILERQHSPFAFRLGPEFVIEMKHVTTISQEGGDVILELINGRIRFGCSGVFTQHVLNELTRRASRNLRIPSGD